MRCSWDDVPIGGTFELVNDKRWRGPQERRTRTTTRYLLVARDADGATVEMTVTGSLPEPHVSRVRVPLSSWPMAEAEGLRVTALGEEIITAPAGTFRCQRCRVEIDGPAGALVVENWMSPGLPVPVRSVHQGEHAEVTTLLVGQHRPPGG